MNRKEMINWCRENMTREDWGKQDLLPSECGWYYLHAEDLKNTLLFNRGDDGCVLTTSITEVFTGEQPTYLDKVYYVIKFEGRKEAAQYQLSTNTFRLTDASKHCDIPASIVDSVFLLYPTGEQYRFDDDDEGISVGYEITKECELHTDPKTKNSIMQSRSKPRSVYDREILPGIFVDVYDVSNAFKPKSEQVNHALKKVLAAGDRGHKDYKKDIKEAIWSLECELQRLEMWGDDND